MAFGLRVIGERLALDAGLSATAGRAGPHSVGRALDFALALLVAPALAILGIVEVVIVRLTKFLKPIYAFAVAFARFFEASTGHMGDSLQ